MPKRRSPGEGSITRRKDGSWQGSITIGYDRDGKQRRRYVSGRTQAAVRTKLHALQTQLQAGQLPADEIGVAAFLEMWLKEKARQVKPNTIQSYRYTIEQYVLPRVGQHKLHKLTSLVVQQTLGEIADAVTPNTSNYCRSLLYAALEQAVRWNLLPNNPVTHIPRLRHAKAEMRVWTTDETRRFLQAAAQHRLYALFYLAITSGLRIGELLGLQWADLRAHQLHVRRTLTQQGRQLLLTTPKTHRSDRIVTLANDTLMELELHRLRQEAERAVIPVAFQHPEHMFVSEAGTYLDVSNVRRAWNSLQSAADLPHARLHDTRHLHVSLLVKHGVDARTIADRIGHTNAAFTLKQYSHAFEEQRQAAAIPLETLLTKTE